MKLWLSHKASKIIEVREKNGSVKIQKLESNNKDVDRDADESNINESFDSLRPIEILSMHSCSAALSFISFLNSPSHSSIRMLFCLPHFARVTSFKKNQDREKSLRLRCLECFEIHASPVG